MTFAIKIGNTIDKFIYKDLKKNLETFTASGHQAPASQEMSKTDISIVLTISLAKKRKLTSWR